MKNLLIMHNQQAVTSSTNIAETFNKQHAHILRDVDQLRKDVSNFGEMFFETTEPDSYGRDRRIYLMNRDGFTLLAMGFTGSKALHFKVEYINAFNQMERQMLQQPKSQAELIAMMAQNNVEQERRLSLVEQEQKNTREILALTNNDWRNKVNAILNGIALKLGGGQYYSDIKNESYQLLEDRAGCSISIRVNNRKAKMALRGSSKSTINKTTALDIIAEDKKLIAVYITVVKEMAVKYQLNIARHRLEEELEALSL
ncbi:Rha family transcriptional regulator [Planococcus plakortidis]